VCAFAGVEVCMSDLSSQLEALGDVPVTGLLAAMCRAKESRHPDSLLPDSAAEAIAERLAPALSVSGKPLFRRLARGKIRQDLVVHFALRARKYDDYARDFAVRHPDAAVVNLGSGLDTRFQRLDDGRLTVYDLDLPEMIELKRELVEQTGRYHLIAADVLDTAWREQLAQERSGPLLFLAEGLFMYLPLEGVRALVLDLQARFPGSELAFEAVGAVWLRPSLRWMIDIKLRSLGLGAGTSYRSGLTDGREPESWGPGIHLLEEWSYLEEDEPRIGPIRWFKGWRLFSRSQWTVRYHLGPPGP
jgi:methyltransferase (TIGR00027 family)